jgi:hypothetical protein
MLPLGRNPEWGSSHGHIPPLVMVILPKMVKHHFLQFDARLLLLNFKILLEMFWKGLNLGYRMNILYNISSQFFRG